MAGFRTGEAYGWAVADEARGWQGVEADEMMGRRLVCQRGVSGLGIRALHGTFDEYHEGTTMSTGTGKGSNCPALRYQAGQRTETSRAGNARLNF